MVVIRTVGPDRQEIDEVKLYDVVEVYSSGRYRAVHVMQNR